MKAATLEFLKQRFTDYYEKEYLLVPPSLGQREWGFIFFDPDYPEIRMRRHIGFSSREDLIPYIRSMVPAHAYYSTAYYVTPGAPTMGEKQWLGADLIFDLDADHIVRGPYDMMLRRVKEETEKLISMLTDEMGFDPGVISIVFSGGRGYHVHIRDIAVRGWGSGERRELIDYVCGIGLDPALVLNHRTPSPRGWHHRYISSLTEYLQRLDTMDQGEAVRELSTLEGVGKVTAEEFYKKRRELMERLNNSPESVNFRDHMIGKVLPALLDAKEGDFYTRLVGRAARADEPVTTDIKRLIRMPSSLHGGSGLRVTPVGIREFPDFDPLTDAVVFGDRIIKTDVSMKLGMSLQGNQYQLKKGVNDVPEALAVFLCCRGIAEIAGGA